MPKHWFDSSLPHDHKAVNDAVEQGYTFTQMLKDMRRPFEPEPFVSAIHEVTPDSVEDFKKAWKGVVEVAPPTQNTEIYAGRTRWTKLPNCS
jgi:hypothetical protein